MRLDQLGTLAAEVSLWLPRGLRGSRSRTIHDTPLCHGTHSLRSSILKDTKINKRSFPLIGSESFSREDGAPKKERTNRNLKGAVKGAQTGCLGVQWRE